MEDTEMPVVDNGAPDAASGFCGYCGHFIDPIDEPPPEPEREPF
jgi:hypothetical protein